MSKYQPLEKFLASQRAAEIPMTFADVERILGRPLPPSACDHRPWWANETRGHVHAKAWLNAGYETARVDMAAKKLVFRRIARDAVATGLSDEAREFKLAEGGAEKKPLKPHPLIGCMKGTFTLVPPKKAAQPTGPDDWEGLALAKFDRLLFGMGE
jgi:hypothetical protein